MRCGAAWRHLRGSTCAGAHELISRTAPAAAPLPVPCSPPIERQTCSGALRQSWRSLVQSSALHRRHQPPLGPVRPPPLPPLRPPPLSPAPQLAAAVAAQAGHPLQASRERSRRARQLLSQRSSWRSRPRSASRVGSWVTVSLDCHPSLGSVTECLHQQNTLRQGLLACLPAWPVPATRSSSSLAAQLTLLPRLPHIFQRPYPSHPPPCDGRPYLAADTCLDAMLSL